MRSWSLVAASFLASLVSVFSFVIPFCLFLNFRQNHLIHVVSNGMEVMMYLTPFLIVLAFIAYMIVLAVLKLPEQIFDPSQLIKVGIILFSCWMSLVLMIFFEARANETDFSVLVIGLVIYLGLLFIAVLGCMSANVCYLVMRKKINDKKLLW